MIRRVVDALLLNMIIGAAHQALILGARVFQAHHGIRQASQH